MLLWKRDTAIKEAPWNINYPFNPFINPGEKIEKCFRKFHNTDYHVNCWKIVWHLGSYKILITIIWTFYWPFGPRRLILTSCLHSHSSYDWKIWSYKFLLLISNFSQTEHSNCKSPKANIFCKVFSEWELLLKKKSIPLLRKDQMTLNAV